jgi:hypothetical protein
MPYAPMLAPSSAPRRLTGRCVLEPLHQVRGALGDPQLGFELCDPSRRDELSVIAARQAGPLTSVDLFLLAQNSIPSGSAITRKPPLSYP